MVLKRFPVGCGGAGGSSSTSVLSHFLSVRPSATCSHQTRRPSSCSLLDCVAFTQALIHVDHVMSTCSAHKATVSCVSVLGNRYRNNSSYYCGLLGVDVGHRRETSGFNFEGTNHTSTCTLTPWIHLEREALKDSPIEKMISSCERGLTHHDLMIHHDVNAVCWILVIILRMKMIEKACPCIAVT